MTTEYLHPLAIEMLKVAEAIFTDLGIEFYIVGAVARDILLSARPEYTSKRMTNDIDFAIMVGNEEEFYIIKERLLATGLFNADKTEAIKLFYKERLEIDLMPFGGIENKEREIELKKPKLFKMDMPGFLELIPYLQTITIEDLSFKVVSMEGIVLLKLFAWGDRPVRTKDISDIEHIIEAYFDLHSDEIYDNYYDVMGLFDTVNPFYLKLVAARVIGRKMHDIIKEDVSLLERIKDVLRKRPTEEWQELLNGIED